MTSPFATYPVPERTFIPANPSNRGATAPARGTGAKRGRKPKNSLPTSTNESTRLPSQGPTPATSQPTPLQWANVQTATAAPSSGSFQVLTSPTATVPSVQDPTQLAAETGAIVSLPGVVVPAPVISVDGSTVAVKAGGTPAGGEEEGEGEDEMLPAMADDDYSAQLSFQSQSKDNLKVLMDNFSSAQYDRFEAYRRHALPKQAVRKVIQQTLGQQVSQPVAQIVAGFGKVFVGEIVEKARHIQERRGDTGPLSPDHLREAYRQYQLETGRVGAARPLKSKRLFLR